MAAESNSPRNLRKKVRKNYSEVIIDDCFSSPTTSGAVRKQDSTSSDFQCYITDFDSCRLKEKKSFVSCEICPRSKQENMTKYFCGTCKIACCLSCYNVHHREQFSESLRSFCTNCAPNQQLSVSESGKISTKLCSDDAEMTETIPNATLENETTSTSGLFTILRELQKDFEKNGIEFSPNEALDCIFFQDKQMKEFFNYYPEFVALDVPCEIVELEYILYLFMCEDPNGHCEIIAGCLLKSEDACTLTWLCDSFKEHNPSWAKMQVILADHQIQNLEVLHLAFPSCPVLHSTFHATQSFKTAVSVLDVEKTSKASTVKLFEEIANAINEPEYEKLYGQLKHVSDDIALHFIQNWHSKKNWRIATKFTSKLFLNPTNKFLCLIRKKMKATLNTPKKCLESFLKSFFVMILNYRKDRFETLSAVFQMMTITSHTKSPHYKYAKFLTQYAGKMVLSQLNLASEIKSIKKISAGKYEVSYQSTTVTVGPTCCSCDFYRMVSLPCCHIFAVRKLLLLPLFLEILCSIRWVVKCYHNTFVNLHAIFMEQNFAESGYKHYSEENFRRYFDMCGQLVPLVSGSGANQRASLLNLMLDSWKHDINVNVKTSEIVPAPESKEMEFDCSIDHLKNLYGVAKAEELEFDDDFSSVSLCSDTSDDDLMKCIADVAAFNEADS